MVQNFFFGVVFYTYVYILPLYFQNVRQFSALRSAVLTVPLVLTQAFASILSGQYISRTKRYGECIVLGFVLFTLGVSLTTLFDRDFPVRYIVGILVVFGYGNGNVFQPTIVALQAHARKSQRAIVISVRNFLRCLGGAIGLAVSAAVLQNVLKDSLPEEFAYLAASTYARPDYAKFSPQDAEAIMNAYAKGSRAQFILMSPLAGICLLTCAFVRDHGLVRPEEREAMEREKAEREAREAEENRRRENGQDEADRDLEKGVVPSSSHEAEHEVEGSEGDKHSEIAAEKVEELGIVQVASHPSMTGSLSRKNTR